LLDNKESEFKSLVERCNRVIIIFSLLGAGSQGESAEELPRHAIGRETQEKNSRTGTQNPGTGTHTRGPKIERLSE
jgi:hypothetical protein